MCTTGHIVQTMTSMIFILGIAPEITLVFKAVVVVTVCLLQAPKFRALLTRGGRRPRPAPSRPPGRPEPAAPPVERIDDESAPQAPAGASVTSTTPTPTPTVASAVPAPSQKVAQP